MSWSIVLDELVYAWRSLWRTPALLDRLLFRQPAAIRQPKEIHRLYARGLVAGLSMDGKNNVVVDVWKVSLVPLRR